ncbi:MAG: hypothetical protein FJ104_05785, partial [Deltaproteobacteria bacterium]|nr:hypothetical protein [Deltaproteobacteria bacterium]
ELITAVKGGRRLDDTLAAMLPELAARAIAEESSDVPAREKPEERDARVAASTPVRDARAPRFEVSSPFGLDGSPVPGAFGGPPLGKLAFDLEVDAVHPEPITVAGATLVLQLKEKTVPTREEFDQKKAELLRELLVARRAEALTAYVARLRKERAAEIQVSASVLEEPRAADAE